MSHTLKRTKIVATIGPGSESADVFRKILLGGVDVARTNMSHDDQEAHAKRIRTIRAVSKKEKVPVAILQDLSGPKIRIGDFKEGTVELKPGSTLILSGKKCEGTAEKVYFNYPHIKKDIKPGMTLMLDDGKKKVVVEKVEGSDVYTKVVIGGITKSRRGVNIPGAYLSIPALTEKDRSDLEFGIKEGVDFVALSFVRTAKDIEELRELIKKHKGTQLIVAKIETQEAVENMDAIVAATDAVMVARGDLAVEIGPEKVPNVQKKLIQKCNDAGKPVIVATQMLESMINAPTPTRAEVSDVANAIYDGADAVMLSEETSLGKFPLEAITVMGNIAVHVEDEIGTHRRHQVRLNDIVDSVSSSVVHNAEDVSAKVIAAITKHGFTARMIARYRPRQKVIAFTPSDIVARQLNLVYGCRPIVTPKLKNVAAALRSVAPDLKKLGFVEKGDRVVVTAGMSGNDKESFTNMMIILPIQ